MTKILGAVSFSPSPEQTVSSLTTQARAFLAYLDSAPTTSQPPDPDARQRMKRWIWDSIKRGYRPALLPDDHIYRPENDDAD